jgi:hypothetical protein
MMFATISNMARVCHSIDVVVKDHMPLHISAAMTPEVNLYQLQYSLSLSLFFNAFQIFRMSLVL